MNADDLNCTMISVHSRCQSENAKKLCIREFLLKMTQNDQYDLGGTYTGTRSDLWFYMTSSTFSESGYLINLFVCHRYVGHITITITFNGATSTHILKSTKPNENYHLKTLCATEELISHLKDNTLYIPITVETDATQLLNPEVIKEMKIENSKGELLLKNKETDFVLESSSGKQYPVHKVVLCAHSPVLRELVKNSAKRYEFLDISDEDMKLLIHFLYTGTVEDLHRIDCVRMQELAGKFELLNLFLLAQHLICDKINIENAVQNAVIANKYNLDQLWTRVCSFIQQHPEVLATDSWKSLNDIDLTKKLFAALITE